MALKEEVKENVQSNYDATVDYMQQINNSFIAALEDEKKKKKHEQTMDAVLSLWLSLLFENFTNDIYTSAQIGIDIADKQLKELEITTVADKGITAETFEKQCQARIDSVKNDLITLANEIKGNSSSMFSTLAIAITNEQREQLAAQLLKVLKENGISFFYDKAGRKWKIENYVKMRTMTELVQAQRMSFFTRATQFGVDLVRIKHLNLHPTCELCAPFNNKILSINGNTPGYMTIQEAAMQGLFHPNCDHVPEEFELVTEKMPRKMKKKYKKDLEEERNINLNEANEKRAKYNAKKKI